MYLFLMMVPSLGLQTVWAENGEECRKELKRAIIEATMHLPGHIHQQKFKKKFVIWNNFIKEHPTLTTPADNIVLKNLLDNLEKFPQESDAEEPEVVKAARSFFLFLEKVKEKSENENLNENRTEQKNFIENMKDTLRKFSENHQDGLVTFFLKRRSALKKLSKNDSNELIKRVNSLLNNGKGDTEIFLRDVNWLLKDFEKYPETLFSQDQKYYETLKWKEALGIDVENVTLWQETRQREIKNFKNIKEVLDDADSVGVCSVLQKWNENKTLREKIKALASKKSEG